MSKDQFINPYNFVRVERDPALADRGPLICGHDQYMPGTYTGRLACTLELVTPIFTPDPEQTIPAENNQPRRMAFCRGINGQPLLPGTSLKGMIRSTLETVSNSCFSQINDKRLDFRESRVSQHLEPAVITQIDHARKEIQITCLEDTAWLPSGYKGGPDYRNGMEKQKGPLRFAYANLAQIPAKHKQNRVVPQHFVVTDPLATDVKGLPSRPGATPCQVLIKHTGKTIFNKHDERVFFCQSLGLGLKARWSTLAKLTLPFESLKDFDYILAEQHIRFEKLKDEAWANRQMALRLNRKGPSSPQKGDLVYVYRVKNALALVLIPRLRYKKSPVDLLPPHLRPCADSTRLCPACRLFGTVAGDNLAIQGRVSFSSGRWQSSGKPAFTDRVVLSILGSPQPTSTNFYLTGDGYDNSQTVTVRDGGYDRHETILRGRKHYWMRSGNASVAQGDRFNAEVEILHPKDNANQPAKFQFQVDFENLSRDELALLVWALELEPGMYHRLGMGKSLGLGAIRIQIQESESLILDGDGIRSYYSDLATKSHDLRIPPDVKNLKALVASKYQDSVNYKDLKAILSWHPDLADLVKYPCGMRGGKSYGYQWFMDNRETQPLLTIPQILKGNRQTNWKGEV